MSNLSSLLAKGSASVNQGDVTGAREAFEQAVRDYGDRSEPWINLSAVHGMEGNYLEALRCARKAVELAPNSLQGWANLGHAAQSCGELNQAEEGFVRASTLPGCPPGIVLRLGLLLTQLGKWAWAVKSLRNFLVHDPGNREATLALANALAKSMKPEAGTILEEYCRRNPGDVQALTQLGTVFLELGKIEDARRICDQALQVSPDMIEVLFFKVLLLTFERRNDEARNVSEQLMEIQPDDAQLMLKLSNIFKHASEVPTAIAYARAALKINPRDIHALKSLSKMVLNKNPAEAREMKEKAVVLMEEMLQRDKLPDHERQQLHFEVGELYEQLERYHEAFEKHRQANAFDRVRFSREAHDKRVNDIIAFFQQERIRGLPKARITSDRPIFIVGMPRSGTSLVEQILASHPRIFGAGELNDIGQFTHEVQDLLGAASQYPACLGRITPVVLDSLAKQYLDRLLTIDKDAARVTDKMPHNFLHLGMIAMLFPGARIIHTIRNPMDTCLSIYFHHFNHIHAYSNNLSDLGYYYRSYEKVMAHWRSVLDLPLFEIRYEELVVEPDIWIPRLVEFCGVEWDTRCMQFHETKRLVNTPSTEQVREPMYTRSVNRWRHYETQLEPLKTALGPRALGPYV